MLGHCAQHKKNVTLRDILWRIESSGWIPWDNGKATAPPWSNQLLLDKSHVHIRHRRKIELMVYISLQMLLSYFLVHFFTQYNSTEKEMRNPTVFILFFYSTNNSFKLLHALHHEVIEEGNCGFKSGIAMKHHVSSPLYKTECILILPCVTGGSLFYHSSWARVQGKFWHWLNSCWDQTQIYTVFIFCLLYWNQFR